MAAGDVRPDGRVSTTDVVPRGQTRPSSQQLGNALQPHIQILHGTTHARLLKTQALQPSSAATHISPECAQVVLDEVTERNPRTDLRWARDDAHRLKDIVGSDWDLLDAADQTVLSRASRAKDITRAQIKEIEKRFHKKQHQGEVTEALMNPDQWSRAMRHPRETWSRIIEKRRAEARSPRHREALRRLMLFSKAEAASSDWMGFGTREAYLHAIGATIEIVAWAAEGRFLWPEPDPDGCFRFGLGDLGGPDAMTPASSVPAQKWDALLDNRRHEVREIGDLCRLPAFVAEDAATTPDWMGYGSRDAYLQHDLGITEDLVAWANEGLRLFGLPVEPKGRRGEDMLAVLDYPTAGR